MTLSLSEITDRLINFRHQIQYYETAAYEISSHPCSEEKISRTKLEYERFHTEIVNFKKDVQCIAEKLVNPFKEAILLHCNCLKKDCKGLGETLERSYLTNEMSYELDSLFKKYLFFATSKDRSNLSHIDILKQKNLSIITLSYPIPTPSQLKMSMDLQNTIQRHQEFSVGEMLREVHLLIEKTEYTSIDKILNKDLLHCQLGRDVRNDIYEQLWITAARHPCIHFFDTWSATNFVDHLPELDRIITSQPLYKKLEIGNSIETEDVKFDVGKMLKEIHRLINEATCCPKERRQQFYDSIGSIFKDLSSSELGLATKNQIFKQVWEDDNVHFFGEIIARSDESNPDVYLLKLSNIISSNPFYINPDISETVDSIELLEKDEGYASDLEGIEEKQIPLELLVEITIETVEEEANNLPNETKGKVVDDEMDTSEDDSDIIEVPIADVHFVTSAQHLNSVQTEIQEIICISDFSMEERTDAINTARRRLPDDLRWLLDGIFYELSRDPNKGGEAWADKHSAEDPSVLLEAIEELKKRIV